MAAFLNASMICIILSSMFACHVTLRFQNHHILLHRADLRTIPVRDVILQIYQLADYKAGPDDNNPGSFAAGFSVSGYGFRDCPVSKYTLSYTGELWECSCAGGYEYTNVC